ncbi:hypothetical protein M0813_00547 [Anaeramoeba flamelloides]|uniref:Endonuclease/exonuclease/phosphatase domain-containing protein n=1 Tax=Anaeramoeba flamelloides TaxID=1746091 RepID=A0ABQ8YB93_9EUKA|nr:hypothetical protein M0813_00547 [Anaeramoeba flamelloides]
MSLLIFQIHLSLTVLLVIVSSAPSLSLLQVNIGNLDGVLPHTECPTIPYKGACCSLTQEKILNHNITRISPDIVSLLEVFDSDYCKERNYKPTNKDEVCWDYQNPDRPYQQARRILGDKYTILCDAVHHFDCVGLKTSRISVEECPSGKLCIGGMKSLPHPASCNIVGSSWITSVSKVHATIDYDTDSPFDLTVVISHPAQGVEKKNDACRLDEYKQTFETLPDSSHTLILGDFQMDMFRLNSTFFFPSAGYWRSQVGRFGDTSLKFMGISLTQIPPLPTYVDTVTLDYIIGNLWKSSKCTVYGVSPGTMRIDHPWNAMDHQGLHCLVS